MAYYENWPSTCKLKNGYVFDSKCTRSCSYMCWSPYRKPLSSSEYIWCNRSSGEWLTDVDEQPCVLDDVYTPPIKAILDPITLGMKTIKYPTTEPSLYDNDDELNGHHIDSDHQSADNSAMSTWLIVAILVAFMVFGLAFRIGCVYLVPRRRQQRTGSQAERQNNLQRISQHRSNRSLSSTNNGQGNNEERLMILRIKRYLCFRILGRGYRQLRNQPESPPYDVVSAPPPTYEETERLEIPASDVSPENNCSQTFEIPEDPPPPYTANIV